MQRKPTTAFAVFLLAVLCSSTTVASADIPTNWTDCGLPNATLHWVNVTSSPNPLHTGQQQTVTKSGYTDQTYTNVTVEYQQFWLLGKHWFKFLDFKTSACAEHPVICSTKPKEIFTESSLHPKLNRLTPHGMYRSRQVYFDTLTGLQIGCVDMKVPYVK